MGGPALQNSIVFPHKFVTTFYQVQEPMNTENYALWRHYASCESPVLPASRLARSFNEAKSILPIKGFRTKTLSTTIKRAVRAKHTLHHDNCGLLSSGCSMIADTTEEHHQFKNRDEIKRLENLASSCLKFVSFSLFTFSILPVTTAFCAFPRNCW